MAFLQVVVRDACAEMVDMVVADVAGEPLQDLRQLVKRAALQRCRRVIPVFVARPVHVLELMMHVEQTDAGRSAERRVGKECVSTCRSRWSQYTSQKKRQK